MGTELCCQAAELDQRGCCCGGASRGLCKYALVAIQGAWRLNYNLDCGKLMACLEKGLFSAVGT